MRYGEQLIRERARRCRHAARCAKRGVITVMADGVTRAPPRHAFVVTRDGEHDALLRQPKSERASQSLSVTPFRPGQPVFFSSHRRYYEAQYAMFTLCEEQRGRRQKERRAAADARCPPTSPHAFSHFPSFFVVAPPPSFRHMMAAERDQRKRKREKYAATPPPAPSAFIRWFVTSRVQI